MTDTSTDTGTSNGRTGISRPVAFAGIVLGTMLTVWLMTGGLRLRIPGIPSLIGDALGAVVIWLLFMAAAAVLSELTVRHHRAALRHGWRHGKRGGRAAWRGARAGYRGTASWSAPHRARILAALRARWAARRAVRAEVPGAADDGEGPCIYCGAEDGEPCTADCVYRNQDRRAMRRIRRQHPIVTVTGPAAELTEPPAVEAPEPPKRRVCVACGNPEGGKWGPLVTYGGDLGDGARVRLIHRAHFEDPATGFYGQLYQEGNEMENTTSRTPRERARDRGRRAAASAAGAAGDAWRKLIAATADYEPEDDSALLDWMAGEAAGMASYAESITDVYDTAVSGVGLDPVPLAALHDYADAGAACAEAMAAARAKFADHYAQVREFAAAGGLLPHDGRWITGEGT